MKRIAFLLIAIGITTMSSVSMAAMSTSRVRKETRFLTDKMAYELNLTTPQYNDVYEINYDFIYSVRHIMDDVVRGYDYALDRYYENLDMRNDDLRWVLSANQYRRFLNTDYFYRPIYASGNRWSFRIYLTYTNHNHFYFGKPYHYRSYNGAHYRPNYTSSYYRGRYNHGYYSGSVGIRSSRDYQNNRRNDFGSVTTRPSTGTGSRPGVGTAPSTRPGTSPRPSTSTSTRPSSNVNTNTSTGGSSRPSTGTSTRPSTSTSPRPSTSGSTGTTSTRPGSSSSRRDNTGSRSTSTNSGRSSSVSGRSDKSSTSSRNSGSTRSSSSSSSRSGSGSRR